MRIGIIAVDNKIPNLALMKLSAWHKQQGDTVELYQPMFSCVDKIYSSKVFNNTPDYCYYPEGIEIVKGGYGYNNEHLSLEQEKIYPDYSLFSCDYAMGYTTRGCIRNCKFCIVPKREGKIRIVSPDIYSFWKGQKNIMLLDNNILAIPGHFRYICSQLYEENIAVDFCQGLDIRLLTEEVMKYFQYVKIWKQIRFAWDNMKDEVQVINGIRLLNQYRTPLSRIMFYVLIGYNTTPEEDMHRVLLLRENKVTPFVMPYDKRNFYQKQFAMWVNQICLFKKMSFDEYLHTFHREKRKEVIKRHTQEKQTLNLFKKEDLKNEAVKHDGTILY